MGVSFFALILLKHCTLFSIFFFRPLKKFYPRRAAPGIFDLTNILRLRFGGFYTLIFDAERFAFKVLVKLGKGFLFELCI